jgi:glutathione S-transferase
MLLHDAPVSGNCYKVRLLASHLGIELERVETDVIDRSNPRESLNGLNPMRQVPVLVLDDGRVLAESGAILLYLAEGSGYIPDDPFHRAQVTQWLFFEQHELEPNLGVARFLLQFAQFEYPPRLLSSKQHAGREALVALEAHLTGRRFLVEEEYSIADIAVYAYVHMAQESGIELIDYPAVLEWVLLVAAQPGHIRISQ